MELTFNSTALKERLTRFANGDGLTFAMCTSAYAGLYTLHGYYYHDATSSTKTGFSRREKLRSALMRTRGVLPVVSASVAVGIVTMNASIYAVDALRQHHSSISPLIALPIAGGLLSASKGLKGMAQGAAAFGLFALGVQALIRAQAQREDNRIPLTMGLQLPSADQHQFGEEEQVIRD